MARGRRRKAFKVKLKKTTIYTFSSVALFAIAGLIMLSFSQKGTFLITLWGILNRVFGWGVIILPFIFVMAGLMLSRLQWSITQPHILVGGMILLVALVSLTRAGLVGLEIWQNLAVLISSPGAGLVLTGLTFVGLVIIFDTSLEEIMLFLIKIFASIKKTFSLIRKPAFGTREEARVQSRKEPEISSRKPVASEPSFVSSTPGDLSAKKQIWEFPPISLLADVNPVKAERGDIKKNAEVIERTLESFGISARVTEVNLGPAVTQYALEIALGTKLSKVTALSTDLALSLAAPTGQIRIEAPIPGRSLVGVEVPNRTLEFVSLKQMLVSEKVNKAKSKLTVALGLNVSGEPVMTDIARMPHILIAGATGSGKSICLHSFIATILFRATPEEVKFIMVDPKRVELTSYNGIPHLLSPVIVEPDKVISALKWAIAEMDRRYRLFAEIGVRNIDAYNELSGFASLPYILVIIDELADIILFAPAEVEDSICRIAQMARATGIHLIISTQRPSVDVLTGLIKANIPCRIAFNVSSQIDSRVILDTPGAEKLLGRGDMLYIPPDQAKPTRIQGTFVSDQEIQKMIEFLKKAGVNPSYSQEVVSMPTVTKLGGNGEPTEKDEFFEEAVRVIRQYDRASASLLQRRLKVGYARAARIIDQLERSGIVGPAEGAKPREVFRQEV